MKINVAQFLFNFFLLHDSLCVLYINLLMPDVFTVLLNKDDDDDDDNDDDDALPIATNQNRY